MAQQKQIVTIGVGTINEGSERMRAVLQGKAKATPHITFLTYELMWKTLTPKRWQIIGAMKGQGAMSTREAARRVGRDVKAVHGDVRALELAGILKKLEDGKIAFPYDDVHVDFMLNPKPETISEFVAAAMERRRQDAA